MKHNQVSPALAALALLLNSALAHAATVSGTVTNQTSNRPSAGDTVALVDVQAGMADAATAKTDSSGRYSLNLPAVSPYLIRVNHQGASYFIAAPQSGSGADVNVYDVAAKVDGVGLDADMLLIEAAAGVLRVHERFLIRNTSLPPKAQFSDKTFEVVLPSGSDLDSAATTRPGGMATNARLVPLAEKGHYTFNTPIQPSKDDKETMFELQYHVSYSGNYTFHPALQTPADNLVVYLPPGMSFSGAQGASFQSAQQDPKVQTFIAKSVHPGQSIAFTVSGEGQMQAAPQSDAIGMGASAPTGSQPGGGIGAPIGSPDPLTEYKPWILAGLAALLIAAAAFLLKRTKLAGAGPNVAALDDVSLDRHTSPAAPRPFISPSAPPPASRGTLLLNTIKEELFAIESERLSGTLSEDEYSRIRIGLEAVLKRVLHSGSPV